jgi:hypothetical protein
VLLLIIAGGGLVACGGLTLFGHQLVFKTRSQAILGICAGLVILGALEIRFYASSASFLENQKIVVSYCKKPTSGAPKAMPSTSRLPRV